MKTCPFCAEQIQEDAIKCRYCHEFLDGRPAPASDWHGRKRWYHSHAGTMISIAFGGPMVIPMILSNPVFTQKTKIIYAIGTVVLTIAVILGLILFFASLYGRYFSIIDELG